VTAQTLKILIIDNEMTRQRNLRSILTSLGFKSADLESTDDPTIAISNMKKKNFNLVFVYRDLGKTNASAVIKDIRGNMRLKGTPVIVYSSEISKDIIVDSVQGGANGFLGYPFSVSDVEAAMTQATKKTSDGKKTADAKRK
jgi:two-component system chemotaxis response regulator CheY